MFNYFKKEEKPAREHLDGFQNNFTKEQKAAILSSLVVSAMSEGDVHPEKLQIISQIEGILHFRLSDPIFTKVVNGGMGETVRILNTLNKSQKEFLIMILHGVASKVENALTFANYIGIFEEEYAQIILKGELLMKKIIG